MGLCVYQEELSPLNQALLNYIDLVASSLFSRGHRANFIPIERLPERSASVAREVQELASLVYQSAAQVAQDFVNDPYHKSVRYRYGSAREHH